MNRAHFPRRDRIRSGWLACAVLVNVGWAHIDAAERKSLLVFAAASTADAMTDIAKAYEHSAHITVTCSFGSSSLLATQIEQGAPADIFLSADERWMDYLAERTAIQGQSRQDLLSNRLVLIAPVGESVEIQAEKGFDIASGFSGRIAIGDPTHVPAGIYAQEAFTHLGWWSALSDRLAPAQDVRAALRLVEMRETELGIVYATDAHSSTTVTVVAIIPESLHAHIRYPVALTMTADPKAAAFLVYLQSPAATMTFTTAGFTVPVAQAVSGK